MTNTVNQDLAEEFVKQSILKHNPNFDLSKSTGFYNIFVRHFNATLLPEILRIYEDYINSKSLLNTNVSQIDYDRLLLNINFPRKQGASAVVTYKLVLKQPQDINLSITDSYIINDKIFHPTLNRKYTAEDFVLEGNVYTIEYDLQSDQVGRDQNVGINTEVITPFNNNDSFIRAYTTNIVVEGNDIETNEEVLERLQNEYGLETLINIRGINFVLSKYFPNDVQASFIAGFSEVEQRRDWRDIEIPKRIVRLFFNEKVNLILPVNTQLYYNENESIKYIFKGNELVNIPINSNEWKEFFDGSFYVDLPIELLNIYNIQGFKEDVPMTIPYLLQNYNKYTGCHTKTILKEEGKIRIGAHTDVFLKTPVIRRKVSMNVPVNSEGIINIPAEFQPVLKIHKIEELGPNNSLIPVEIFTLIVDEPELRFSSRDNCRLFVKPSLVSGNILVDMTYAPKIKDIQSFFDRPAIRVIAEDTLVRYFNPVFVGAFGVVSGSSVNDPQLKEAVTEYVNSINTGSIILSDMLSIMGQRVPELRAVLLDSLQLIGTQEMPNGLAKSLISDEVLSPETDEDIGVTSRNTTFILEGVEFNYQ